MTLFAVMAVMVIFAIGLLAVAPGIEQEIRREKELESIRRGEEVAEAIKQYVLFTPGNRLPTSMDDLLEGIPFGTKKRQILRASAAIDPLSEEPAALFDAGKRFLADRAACELLLHTAAVSSRQAADYAATAESSGHSSTSTCSCS